jgi:hypothetical protein
VVQNSNELDDFKIPFNVASENTNNKKDEFRTENKKGGRGGVVIKMDSKEQEYLYFLIF